MSEFPRMLYRPARPGQGEDVWGKPCEWKLAGDADEQERALGDGWYLSPADFPVEKPTHADSALSLLDEGAATIIETLPALTPDELRTLLAAEQNGKARKGVIAALEKALAP